MLLCFAVLLCLIAGAKQAKIALSMVLWHRLTTASSLHTSRLSLRAVQPLSGRARQPSAGRLSASRRPSSRTQGVQCSAKLSLIRTLRIVSAVLAGALAVWVTRNSTISDLPADQRVVRTPVQPVAYQEGQIRVFSYQAVCGSKSWRKPIFVAAQVCVCLQDSRNITRVFILEHLRSSSSASRDCLQQ